MCLKLTYSAYDNTSCVFVSTLFVCFLLFIFGGINMNNIKEARLSRGMSQAELAKAVGVSPSAIGMIERGEREPSLKVLKKTQESSWVWHGISTWTSS